MLAREPPVDRAGVLMGLKAVGPFVGRSELAADLDLEMLIPRAEFRQEQPVEDAAPGGLRVVYEQP